MTHSNNSDSSNMHSNQEVGWVLGLLPTAVQSHVKMREVRLAIEEAFGTLSPVTAAAREEMQHHWATMSPNQRAMYRQYLKQHMLAD